MLRWSQDFVERLHAVVANLSVCPFAKATRLNRMIQWEVRPFEADDLLDEHGEVMTPNPRLPPGFDVRDALCGSSRSGGG
jgi:hypothetical protein